MTNATDATHTTPAGRRSHEAPVAVRPFGDLSRAEVGWAGGKGANLGELTRAGLPVPKGFVVGAPAYAAMCDASDLRTRLGNTLRDLDVEDTAALQAASAAAQALVADSPIPSGIEEQIRHAYAALGEHVPVAIRSSATAEDTAEASFAGMNETYLNVQGADAVVEAVRSCWRSLFGARTIYYRAKQHLGQATMDIAVVVQRQIDATRAGVMFTVDPATGDRRTITIEGSLGLGESVVSGSVSPDRYVVEKDTGRIVTRAPQHKRVTVEAVAGGGTRERKLTGEEALAPSLGDDQIARIAEYGLQIERHYGTPQDTEWAIDAHDVIWMLQARPITVLAAAPTEAAQGTVLVRGIGAAPGLATGGACVVRTLAEGGDLADGDVLVAPMTAPDWVPLLRRASALVTDSGGITCHAAIVSRELGIPCVVGTRDGTSTLTPGEVVTVDAGRGVVLRGLPDAPETPHKPELALSPAIAVPPPTQAPLAAAAATPVTATKVLLNLSEPSQAEALAALPVDGVGLLRAELMLIEALEGAHPQQMIEEGREDEAVARMADALTRFATAFSPRPITYRTIDFRTNEFRGLRGGERFEPVEANPMIGLRGVLRSLQRPEVLRMELSAIERVWDEGHTNLHVMLPFVRTASELERCIEIIRASGMLGRGGFELWIMAEVPSVLFALEAYAKLGITGISIGSNDLTQLLLAADRDSELVAETFDERDPAVVRYIEQLIAKARSLGLRTSICGQAPSVYEDYAAMLVRAGIDAISVNPDAAGRTRASVAQAEQRILLDAARRAVKGS